MVSVWYALLCRRDGQHPYATRTLYGRTRIQVRWPALLLGMMTWVPDPGAIPSMNETKLWIRNARFTANHIAAGSYDSAMQVNF